MEAPWVLYWYSPEQWGTMVRGAWRSRKAGSKFGRSACTTVRWAAAFRWIGIGHIATKIEKLGTLLGIETVRIC